ncbi:helicase and polymerase-containing protein TEBICHI isoform X3 [Amaranthus tricolor]|uniref:helicase and polymerase-containing protein TEBICHI isoform X3 n=1 Tax=Amaranthus tricolor TaxID=29722 RepID=UPI002582CF3E|nr:helicase and polymerase-containing protein TEBICHI isoform X3 [Amaranthus tricolor]
MDLNDNRSRIDQFFSSKKKRTLSPKIVKDSSPSAKGTLESYLVASQNESVKRNLALEIDLSTKNVNGETLLLSDDGFGGLVPSRPVPREDFGAGDAGSGSGSLDTSDQIQDFEDEENLIQYCSQVQQSSLHEQKVNGRKRFGSPSELVVEGTTSKRRHYVVDKENSLPDEQTPPCDKRAPDAESCSSFSTEAINSTARVDFNKDFCKSQVSLRKCNKITESASMVNDCTTPAARCTKLSARETPVSLHGSSVFSLGEAFWNEAIQVIDGLCAQTGNDLHQVGNDTCMKKTQDVEFSRDCAVESSNNKVNVPADIDASCSKQTELNTTLLGKFEETGELDASPLPVKHFDFSCDGKNLVVGQPSHLCLENRDRVANDSTTWSSVDQKRPEDKNATPPVFETQKRRHDLLGPIGGNISKDSPNRDIADFVVPVITNGATTPSSYMPLKDGLDISNWLPSAICNIYKRKGIAKLYPWQVDCLQIDGVLEKRNLVYCASTSAGKSFVAEILMLRRVIDSGKIALLVLPYVSICVEKAEHLEVLLEPIGKHVRTYYGSQGGGTLPKDTSVAVCTIEKANSLVNRLLEEDRLSEVGIIVIDELHMVADPSRGYLLELLLTKLRYAAGEGNGEACSGGSSATSSGKGDIATGLQIVGMSATMPNVAAVADWLHAALYQTEFRPVPLEEYIKVGNNIFDKSMEIVRTFPKSANLGGKDPDHVVELCNEVVQDGHSVLIFCSSRKGCESTAKHISMYLKKFSVKIQDESSEFTDVFSAIDALRRCPVGLDPVLEETLPSGVAYHHAGLTVEEREIVETCYRKGLVRVLTATSTLAAGVNLPARRVIFRQPKIGCDFIDGTRYKQMAGRAGRTGIDAKGESVLICRPEEIKRIKALLNDSCPPLQSCLSEDKNGMTHAILEVVASGIVQTANDIHRYVRCTLLNSTKPFEDVVKSAQDSLRWLCHKKFLEWNEHTKLYSATPLGRASFGSSLSPEESLIVLDDLSRAREGFVLASDLHLVYLATPTNVDVEPDWELFYERFMQLSSIEQSVGNRVGIVEPFLMRMAHGAPVRTGSHSRNAIKGLHSRIDSQLGVSKSNALSDEQSLRVCRRFYVALILSRLVQELPVGEVCAAFKVARGMVQALQENAGRFASMVSLFCERLGWQDLEGLFAKFQNRFSFGVRAEIVELTTIPCVKGSRARALYKGGLRTPLAIAEASITEIEKALFESVSWTAQADQAQRRIQLGIAKKIKNGARKIVLDRAEEARVTAFSAFQSLGLTVPQLSCPVLLPTNDGSNSNGSSNTGENSTSSFAHYKRRGKDISIGRQESEAGPDTNAGRSAKCLDTSLDISNKVNALPIGGIQVSSTPTKDLVPSSCSDLNETMSCIEAVDKEGQRLGVEKSTSGRNKLRSNDKGPINVASASSLDTLLDLWESVGDFHFDVHFSKKSEANSLLAYEVHGLAICWENSLVYYVNLAKILRNSDFDSCNNECSGQVNSIDANILLVMKILRWHRIVRILERTGVRKFTWNLKIQVQVLKNAGLSLNKNSLSRSINSAAIELVDGSFCRLPQVILHDGIDLCVVAWILWPEEEKSSNPSLEKEVKKRVSSEAAAAANQSGRWKNQMRRAAHNGCCRRVAQVRALHCVLWKLLVSEGLVDALMSIELPLVHVLADMEDKGIGVDMEGCLKARKLLSKKLKILENEAYKLAGVTFSLYMPADIANVLYDHLKLPIPEGRKKGKQHVSTDKQCLNLLRLEHPIVPVIKEHRTLAKLLNCTLGSICSLAKLSMRTQRYTLHGHWLQTSTATGRLSMEEPNLQCVAHMVEFRMHQNGDPQGDSDGTNLKINARDFFIPTEENWLLLTADYSQIELRLMAHFSRDLFLIELLSKSDGDAFSMIASRWTGKPEHNVSSQEREQTKRLVYGILYGMGANSLAEQLNCSADEAKEKIQSFKNSFPGVASWLHEAVAYCRQHGYVQTLKGRKRFLSKIKVGNSKEKAKAERQAVNSICQGSAADIIKIAMINLYSVIAGFNTCNSTDALATKFSMLKGHCHILLQVHDELVLEVEPAYLKEAGLLLKTCMESAASLLVPLRAKVKVGRTWGSLEPLNVDDAGE